MRTLLLFDVDGVLIHPKGYKVALQATVDYFAEQMGLPPVELTFDEIAVFEACGLTNEWDSAAFSVGALLCGAFASENGFKRDTFDDVFSSIRDAQLNINRPDFVMLAKQVADINRHHETPTVICRDVLKSQSHTNLHPLLDLLFADIYSLDTPTTLIQQVYTLGSKNFTKTYRRAAPLHQESYLVKYDSALLKADYRQRLLDWNQDPEHGFVIYTARPSSPPKTIDDDPLGYAPEADLAAELLGFNDQVPLIASGRMEWLAHQHHRHAADYIKPSPVQALAAIGAAFSRNELAGLNAAARLFEQHELIEPFSSLRNQPTQVVVFDDSMGGLHAARLAVERLITAGINGVKLEMVGVAPEDTKRNALTTIADRVVDDINEGLASLL